MLIYSHRPRKKFSIPVFLVVMLLLIFKNTYADFRVAKRIRAAIFKLPPRCSFHSGHVACTGESDYCCLICVF